MRALRSSTHDLRMVEYADRVIQMLDGHVDKILSTREDLSCLANPAECRMIPPSALGYGAGAVAAVGV